MRRIRYREGDVFAVPVRDGWAQALIARVAPLGVPPLVYAFGDWAPSIDELPQLETLTASEAIFRGLIGDAELKAGIWPIRGRHPSFDRKDWPVPTFLNTAAKPYKVQEYTDDLERIRPWRDLRPDEDSTHMLRDRYQPAMTIALEVETYLAAKERGKPYRPNGTYPFEEEDVKPRA